MGLTEASYLKVLSAVTPNATVSASETPMADAIKTGSILIKDGTSLPDAPRFETEPCATGWRLVKNLDGYGLGRKVHDAGWNFFCLAGGTKATMFGFDRQRNVRRALKRILTNLNSEKFNGLEIIRVAAKRFMGLPYATVYAQSRHIQESAFLLQVKGVHGRDRSKLETL